MVAELCGHAGTLAVEDNGRVTIRRGDQMVLLSDVAPVFGGIYGVQAQANRIAHVEFDDQHVCVVYGSSLVFGDQAIVFTLEAHTTPHGFCVTVTTSELLRQIGVSFVLRPGGPWYGLGERIVQTWPLDAAQVISDPLLPYDHAHDGTLNISTPLLLGAMGVGLLVKETEGDVFVTLNRSGDNLLRLGSYVPEPPYGADIDAVVKRSQPCLVVDVLLAESITEVAHQAIRILGHPSTVPPAPLWSEPIWTTWARYKMAVDQTAVLAFAHDICSHGYSHSVMEIDDRWQTAYGDLAFDAQKFPDPGAMVAQLHAQGFRVTLWVPPFFAPESTAFAEAAEHGFLLKHPADDTPYLTRWWQGFGALLDVSNDAALAWWHAKLRRLQTDYGVDGFKFDGGEASFVPTDARSALPLSRRNYTDRYVAWVAEHFAWTEVRTGWRSQRCNILFRQWDKWSRWGRDNGLHSVLTQALTMSMIGYPFILPDMVGGNAYNGERPDRELLIRWTQLSALLPAMQFSIPPWEYDAETNTICRYWADVHQSLASYRAQLMEATTRDGTPLVRPLFWHAPHDAETYAIDDQFLLGERFLVAPVLAPGARARDIYLPSGTWRARGDAKLIVGGQWLRSYSVPLDILPVFERMS